MFCGGSEHGRVHTTTHVLFLCFCLFTQTRQTSLNTQVILNARPVHNVKCNHCFGELWSLPKEQNLVKGVADISEETYLTAFAFCARHFLLFMWEFKLCLRGKLFLTYSPLRADLQQVFYYAFDTLLLPTSNYPGTNEEAAPQALDALSLAKALCTSFETKPGDLIEVVAEGESETMKRVCLITMTKTDEIVEPMKTLIEKVLPIPPAYHDVIKDAVTRLLSFSLQSCNIACDPRSAYWCNCNIYISLISCLKLRTSFIRLFDCQRTRQSFVLARPRIWTALLLWCC